MDLRPHKINPVYIVSEALVYLIMLKTLFGSVTRRDVMTTIKILTSSIDEHVNVAEHNYNQLKNMLTNEQLNEIKEIAKLIEQRKMEEAIDRLVELANKLPTLGVDFFTMII